MVDLELLKSLCELPGAPGREEPIRAFVKEKLEPLCDELSVDAIGNLIGIKRATARGGNASAPPRLMISSHLDEISFMVTHIDDQGYLRFTTLGGFDAKTLTSQRVIVHGREDLIGVLGTKPIHIMTDDEKKVAPKLSDYFVDVGLSADEVRSVVSIGDVITRQRDVVEIGHCVTGKSFDNRMGVFVMLEALARVENHGVDIYAVASTQEEIGIRGAAVATRNIDPDLGIALDTTVANDVPEAKSHEYITELGKGVAIKIMDSSVVCNPKVVDFLKQVAEEENIEYQTEILTRGGTDTAAIQRSGKGAAVGCVSIPTRYVHSVIETCHKDDVEAAIRLLTAFIERAHTQSFAL